MENDGKQGETLQKTFFEELLRAIAYLLGHLLEHPWTNLLVVNLISTVTASLAWGWL